jgi:S-adenosylmethionine:tRNA ribosyltransferase-isomerase
MSAFAAADELPLTDELIAHEPPEARGLPRDRVRLMVSRVQADSTTHTRFDRLPAFLRAGDLVVVNASATINAAFDGMLANERVLVHLSTPLHGNRWVVELRRLTSGGHAPLLDASAGRVATIRPGGTVRLVAPYSTTTRGVRLWVAELRLPLDVLRFAERFGAPIRYAYVPTPWHASYYQTLFAREPGSAEMPSAGRAFTTSVVARLAARGVRIAPIVLHTGVSSLEDHEPPYPERYRVSAATARIVNATRAAGGRVIAVGTTAVRALETVARDDGVVHAGQGWTDLVITSQRGVRAIDGLLTGLHPPGASHLRLLEAFAPRDHLRRAYEAAIVRRYHWHEFGDLHVIIP